jgi:hypothetical protein
MVVKLYIVLLCFVFSLLLVLFCVFYCILVWFGLVLFLTYTVAFMGISSPGATRQIGSFAFCTLNILGLRALPGRFELWSSC